jgi:hypothetical protein
MHFLHRIVSSSNPHIRWVLLWNDFMRADGVGVVRDFFKLLEISTHELSQKNIGRSCCQIFHCISHLFVVEHNQPAFNHNAIFVGNRILSVEFAFV